jgi:hypothetical protein
MGQKLLIYSIRMLNSFFSFACRVATVFNLFIDRKGKYNGIGNDAEWHINQTETSYSLRVVHFRMQETTEIEHGAAVYPW